MLLSNSQENEPTMLKKVPIMPIFFSTKYSFLTITNTYSTFRGKSEGLGNFSLLNNEMTRMSTSWPYSWESSGSLLKLSTAAGPLLLLLCLLSLDSVLEGCPVLPSRKRDVLLSQWTVDGNAGHVCCAAARTCSRRLHLMSTTRALFPLNCPIIPEYCCMLLRTDYSGNYAGILDASLPTIQSAPTHIGKALHYYSCLTMSICKN